MMMLSVCICCSRVSTACTRLIYSFCWFLPRVTYHLCRDLEDYIDEIKFCFDGVRATWPDDCEDDCDEDDLNRITFVSTTETDEQRVVTVDAYD